MQNILIAGGTGLVGMHLSNILRGRGYHVMHLSRSQNPNANFPAYAWDIESKKIDQEAFSQADFIINLAGTGIADKRWTDERKEDIIKSRTKSTLLLKEYIAIQPNKVKAYLSASAIGYYGDRENELLIESASAGKGFLAESTLAWENAIAKVAQTGMRTVALRTGIVLSTEGGALEKMLMSFTFRMGVYFGDGKQWFSWIHIDDLCNMFVWALEHEEAQGVYNAVAPNPLSNYDLTKAVSQAKGGGYILVPAPAFALRIAMGEMANVVLNSSRVSSQKIENQGFRFQFPEAVAALKDLFRRKI